MRQVRVHGPDDVRVDEVEPPRPGTRDAVVRIAACGICGTDLTYIRHGGVAGPTGTPMCLGHEMAGVVDWVGSEVATVAVGDRVVVHPGNDELGRIGNPLAVSSGHSTWKREKIIREFWTLPISQGSPVRSGFIAPAEFPELPGGHVALPG